MKRALLRLAGLAALAGGCTEYGYTQRTNTDVFQQVRRNTVDVLMVVDNSCSMWEEQDKLAANFSSFIGAFEGVDVDWQMGVVTTDMADENYSGRFLGGDDEIVLVDADGREIDRVAWDSDWDIEEGVALQLDAGSYSSTLNDLREDWCPSLEASASGDLGTPGRENHACKMRYPAPGDTGGATADTGRLDTGGDTGGDTGSGGGGSGGGEVEPPSAGDVIVTEFLADPAAVADSLGEWVELTNLTEHPVDLGGCQLVDDGRNAYTFPDGTTIAANGILVLGRSEDPAENGGIAVDLAVGDDFTLNNAVTVLTHDTEDAGEIFSEMVAVGTSGSGIEMGLEAARTALSDELLATRNAGFLREDASLSLIFVSDENDYSGDSVNDYLRYFKDLKGDAAYRDNHLVNLSAVVGVDEPPYDGMPSCESSNGVADWGVRYVDLATRTDGALESICDEDFSPIARELGLTVSGLKVEFELSEPADENSLVVELYDEPDESGFLGELVRDEDYTYDPEANAIRFEEEQVPPSETWIVATYKVLAAGAARGRR